MNILWNMPADYLQLQRGIIHDKVEKMQERNRAAVNEKRRPDPGYKLGDLVLIESHPISNLDKGFTSKLAPRRDGPYTNVYLFHLNL